MRKSKARFADVADALDNPEWTEEDFARAVPAREFFSPYFFKAVDKQRAWARKSRPKKPVNENQTPRRRRYTPATVPSNLRPSIFLPHVVRRNSHDK